MRKSDRNSLEHILFNLPFDLKRYYADRLRQQLTSQVDTLLETARRRVQCPRCGGEHAVKWGHSAGLQRYRCKRLACGRTFNALTGTPLAKLRHREKWFGYLACMLDSLTLRRTAARLGIALKTAFRWRHRFLHASAWANSNALTGIIEVDETFFKESCKGKRRITHRAPRKRGGDGNRNKKDAKIPVFIARDRHGQVSDRVAPALTTSQITAFLAPIVDHDSILCSDGAGWYRTFSTAHGIAHHRLITLGKRRVIGQEYHIQNVNGYISRLKRWIARFHGVGTAYLPNYLAWRRLFETVSAAEDIWLRGAMGINQQRKPT